jgi:hypothetical protein
VRDCEPRPGGADTRLRGGRPDVQDGPAAHDLAGLSPVAVTVARAAAARARCCSSWVTIQAASMARWVSLRTGSSSVGQASIAGVRGEGEGRPDLRRLAQLLRDRVQVVGR